MSIDILSKVSDLSFVGYFDPSKNMVVAHFYGDGSKRDIMAYLTKDMNWDVREVVKESSKLFADREVITVQHSLIGFEPKDSLLDQMIRKGIAGQAEAEDIDIDGDQEDLDPLYRILRANSYDYK